MSFELSDTGISQVNWTWWVILGGISIAFISALFSASSDDKDISGDPKTKRRFSLLSAGLAALAAAVTAIGALMELGFSPFRAGLIVAGLWVVAAVPLLLFVSLSKRRARAASTTDPAVEVTLSISSSPVKNADSAPVKSPKSGWLILTIALAVVLIDRRHDQG